MQSTRTKLFLSHASEDKMLIADPLAEALKIDYELWYDKYSLTLGDSLLGKINAGLRESDFGIVILSRNFFGKKWTQAELDGLFALEEANRKVILPVWHQIGEDEVKSYSPTLAGRLGVDSSRGIPSILAAIQGAVSSAKRMNEFDVMESIKGRLSKIDKDIRSEKSSKQLLNTTKGGQIVRESVDRCVASMARVVDELAASMSSSEFKITGDVSDHSERSLSVIIPFQLSFNISYFNGVINSAEGARIRVGIWQIARDAWGDVKSQVQLASKEFSPAIVEGEGVVWREGDTELSEDKITIYLADLLVEQIEKFHEAGRRK